jgi:anti-sigma factor RsiW
MTDDQKLSPSEALYALLPWYANGTLRGPEAARLEAALADDPALRASLERVREEQDETVLFNQTVEGAAGGSLDALMDRIEAEAPRRDRSVALWPRLAAALGIKPGILALAAVAAALLLVAGGSVITRLASPGVPAGTEYLTASVEPAGEADRSVLLVTFAPNASIEAVSRLLRGRKATIIEGPMAGGLYRIAVASADAETTLATFKGNTDLVAFAAPGQ